jgi:hypothetical protein
MSALRRWWYQIRRNYHTILLNDCLDVHQKKELQRKIAEAQYKITA